jgi:hypothetical protein
LLTQRERTQRFPRGKFNALVTDIAPRRGPDELSIQATLDPSAEVVSEPETPVAPALVSA